MKPIKNLTRDFFEVGGRYIWKFRSLGEGNSNKPFTIVRMESCNLEEGCDVFSVYPRECIGCFIWTAEGKRLHAVYADFLKENPKKRFVKHND